MTNPARPDKVAVQELVWNPTPVRIKASKIPDHLETILKQVLQDKWVEQNWNIYQISMLLNRQYGIYPSKRQLTSRNQKWGMLKKNRLDTLLASPSLINNLATPENSATRSNHPSPDLDSLNVGHDSEVSSAETDPDFTEASMKANVCQQILDDATFIEPQKHPSLQNTASRSVDLRSDPRCMISDADVSRSVANLQRTPDSNQFFEDSLTLSSPMRPATKVLVWDSDDREVAQRRLSCTNIVNHGDEQYYTTEMQLDKQSSANNDAEMLDALATAETTTHGEDSRPLDLIILPFDDGSELKFSRLQRRVDLIEIEVAKDHGKEDLLNVTAQELLDFESIAKVHLDCGLIDSANRYYKVLFHCWRLKHAIAPTNDWNVAPFIHLTTAPTNDWNVAPFIHLTIALIRILQTKSTDGSDERYYEIWKIQLQTESLTSTCAERFAIKQLMLTLLQRGYHQSGLDMCPMLLSFDEYPTLCSGGESQCRCDLTGDAVVELAVCGTLNGFTSTTFPRFLDKIPFSFTTATAEVLVWISRFSPRYSQAVRAQIASDQSGQRISTPADLERRERWLIVFCLFSINKRLDASRKLRLEMHVPPSAPTWIHQEWSSGKFPWLTVALVLLMAPGGLVEWPADPKEWNSQNCLVPDKLLEDVGSTVATFYEAATRLNDKDIESGVQSLITASELRRVVSIFKASDTSGDGETLLDEYLNHCSRLVDSVTLSHTSTMSAAELRLSAKSPEIYDPPMAATPRSSISGLRSLKSIFMRANDVSSLRSRNSGERVRSSQGKLSINSVSSSFMRWSRGTSRASLMSSVLNHRMSIDHDIVDEENDSNDDRMSMDS